MATFLSMEELLKVCDTIPYPVESTEDPSKIRFPCIVKFILVPKPDTVVDGVTYEGIVYAVSMDIRDFEEFYARLDERERTGIEGYTYAESSDEATSGSVETEVPIPTE